MGLIFVSIFFVLGLVILNILLSKSIHSFSGTSYRPYRLTLFYAYIFIFWRVFAAITLAYPEFFIYYLKEHTSTPFYISDINVLAYHFFQNILLFFWFIWPPFIIIGTISIIKNRLTCSEYKEIVGYAGLLIYGHFISIVLTYLDIFPFIQQYFEASAVLWFDIRDYGAYVSAFRGTFFDVSATISCLWLVFGLFINYNLNKVNYAYIYLFNFWNTFYTIWFCRVFFLLIIVYFFSGGGVFSNTFCIIITIMSAEVVILFIRRSAKLSAWKTL